MVTGPTLTICVPTYNRAGHLDKLLRLIESEILTADRNDIDVVVVNNASTDGTRALLDAVNHPAIRVVNRTTFLLTAEENVIHSLEFCTGTYVWFLGDDDVPIIANFGDHLERFRAGVDDYFIFNAALVDREGTQFSVQTLGMNADEIRGTTVDIALWSGCLFVFAGISNHVVRRSLLTRERGLHYLQASRIYSMVAWMIEAGARARTVLVNRPIVYYRENDYTDGHWNRVAARMNVGDFYFWSLGLVELFTKLIESRALTHSQVGRIFDVTRDGSRYRLLDEIMVKTYQQVRLGVTSRDPRQRLREDQLQQVTEFCLKADPLSYDLMQVVLRMRCLGNRSEAAEHSDDLESASRSFDHLFAARHRVGQWLCCVEQISRGYEILSTGGRYVAIRAGVPGLRETVMRVVDPEPQVPLVFVSDDRAALLVTIGEHVAKARERGYATDVGATVAGTSVVDLAHLQQGFAGSDLSLLSSPAASSELASLRQTIAHQQQLIAIYESNSWAFSYPIRAMSRVLRACLRPLRVKGEAVSASHRD